jgi:carbon monoxide dehydrogenase subunit G
MVYEATVPVHRRLLWSAVTDPERLLGAVPNLVVEASTEQGVAARLRLRVGDRSITFRGIARLVELVPEQLCAVLEIEAVHGRSDGAVEGRLELRLVAAGGGTRIVITPDLVLSGRAPAISPERLAQAGQRLIPRWFEQLASTSPEPRNGQVTLTVVADATQAPPPAPTPPPPASPAGAPVATPPPAVSAAEPPVHGPTLTLITGNAEDASPSPKAPLRLVSDAEQDPEFEPAAEADLWSRGRGPVLTAPLWLVAAAALGLAGLATALLRYLLRRR